VSWLSRVTQGLADATALDATDLELPPDHVHDLLDIARTASHDSGERINAPLLCYVVGLVHARGVAFADAVRAAREAMEAQSR
jgi:hypothetical protein